MDLGALASLATHLPLDARTRDLLQNHQPQGQISELRASWGLEGEALKRYSLKAGFNQLGILPGAYFPGASGLSGTVDLTDKGGELVPGAPAALRADMCSFNQIVKSPPSLVLQTASLWTAGRWSSGSTRAPCLCCRQVPPLHPLQARRAVCCVCWDAPCLCCRQVPQLRPGHAAALAIQVSSTPSPAFPALPLHSGCAAHPTFPLHPASTPQRVERELGARFSAGTTPAPAEVGSWDEGQSNEYGKPRT